MSDMPSRTDNPQELKAVEAFTGADLACAFGPSFWGDVGCPVPHKPPGWRGGRTGALLRSTVPFEIIRHVGIATRRPEGAYIGFAHVD